MTGNISALQALPVDASATSIRLLRLEPKPRSILPNHGGKLLSLSTAVFDLDDRPRYRALSYTWGPPEPTKTIVLNGIDIQIRKNLFDFLQMYAHEQPDDCKYLWIDQLCIDQNNTQERNHQVSMMHRIYTEAYEVVAWLGLHENGSECVMKSLAGFAQVIDRARESLRADIMERFKRKMLLKNLNAVKALLERQYWTRLWIIQEVLLAARLKVYCGRLYCDGTDLQHLLNLLIKEHNTNARSPRITAMREASHLHLYYWNPTRHHNPCMPDMDLSFALCQFSLASCEDPRDKIFGLSAIINPSQRPSIDYGLSIEEVYVSTCYRLYERSLLSCDKSVYRALNCLAHQARLHISLEVARDIDELGRLVVWSRNSSKISEIFRKYLQTPLTEDATTSVNADSTTTLLTSTTVSS